MRLSMSRNTEVRMSNTWGIPKKVEEEISARDKRRIFCHSAMKRSFRMHDASHATIEHFNNDGPLEEKYNVAFVVAAVIPAKERRNFWLGANRLTVEKGE